MAYYFSTKLKNLTFKDAIARTTEALKSEPILIRKRHLKISLMLTFITTKS
jgi:hypothetical protein